MLKVAGADRVKCLLCLCVGQGLMFWSDYLSFGVLPVHEWWTWKHVGSVVFSFPLWLHILIVVRGVSIRYVARSGVIFFFFPAFLLLGGAVPFDAGVSGLLLLYGGCVWGVD